MFDEDRRCFEVDRDTKDYLEDFKKDIKESLKSLEDHIRSLLETTIKPIEGTLNRHTKDIGDLYEKHRETIVDIGKLDGRLKTLEDDKQDKKFSTEMKIIIGIAVITTLSSIVMGLLMLNGAAG